MPISSPISNPTPNPKDVVIIQRANDNLSYGEIHISGSDLIFYLDNSGYLNADTSASFYTNFPPPTSGLIPGNTYPITASWAVTSVNSLNANTASLATFALNANSASWATVHSASEVPMMALAGAKYISVQSLQDIFHSAGWTGGGDFITGSAPGSFTVTSGDGLIRSTNNSTASILWFSWNSASFTASANVEEFVYVDYNGGNPVVTSSTVDPILTDFQTNVKLGRIYYASSSVYDKLHINPTTRPTVGDHAKLMINFNQAIMPYARESGGMIGGLNLTINVSQGAFWEGLNRFTTNAFDSTGSGRFSYFDISGSTWTEVDGNQNIDNLQFNDTGSGLVPLSSSFYKVDWVYLAVDSDVSVVYSQNQYSSLASASLAQAPTMVPPELLTDSFLIGRVIVQSGSATFAAVESAFVSAFTAVPVTDHNSLAGLQGGTTGQYYHLTAAEYTGTGTGVFVRQTGGNLTASVQGTSSVSLTSVSASNSISASHAILSDSASFVQTAQTASFVTNAQSASVSTTASFANSASHADTASFALNSVGSGTTLFTASTYQITASQAVSASHAETASFALSTNATTLFTASLYQITASASENSKRADTSTTATSSLSESIVTTTANNGFFIPLVFGSGVQPFYIDGGNGLVYNPANTSLTMSGGIMDFGSVTKNDIVLLYHNTNTKYGFGVAAGEARYFTPETAHISIGYVTSSDGATFTEYARFDPVTQALTIAAVSASLFGTASWAKNSNTASFALTSPATTLFTASLMQITASWAQFVVSASNALSASYSFNSSTASFALSSNATTLFTASLYQITASQAVSASHAETASFVQLSQTSINAFTASSITSSIINVPNGIAGLDSNGNIVATVIPLQDTEANLGTTLLLPGEAAYATDTHNYFIGNGTSSITNLPPITHFPQVETFNPYASVAPITIASPPSASIIRRSFYQTLPTASAGSHTFTSIIFPTGSSGISIDLSATIIYYYQQVNSIRYHLDIALIWNPVASRWDEGFYLEQIPETSKGFYLQHFLSGTFKEQLQFSVIDTTGFGILNGGYASYDININNIPFP